MKEETLECIDVIGSGTRGDTDGSFSDCSLYHPQGLVLYGSKLIICDTKNHKIREADLEAKTIRTISGTGARGHDLAGGKAMEKQELASPWDIVHFRDGRFFVAMAGSH